MKTLIEQVQSNIGAHCIRANRNKDTVTIIAVSKTKPIEMVQEAYALGLTHFGENKVQEIREKFSIMGDKVDWHMIGHLQTNKVKYIIDKVSLIHSVDSIKLAEEINRQALKHNLVMDILIQVNVAEEETKFGLSVNEVEAFIARVSKLPGIKIQGLMTIAPYVVDAEENRPIFRKIKDISVDIQIKNLDNISMGILSMGMTNDYGVAIEEGATMIRVGTGIFGQRNYSKS